MSAEDLTPEELEERGEYEKSARAYAERGFRELLEHGFEMDLGTRLGIGRLLLAISADRRAGNVRRPQYLGEICRPLLEEVRETAEDPILTGLATEWLGDLAVMTGQDDGETARRRYDEASDLFDGMDWRDERWADEPDFVLAYLAMRRFSEFHDGPLPKSPDDVSFEERLERKRAFARDHLE